jgi:hypothetical protein
MHALSYVNGVGFPFPLYLTLWELEVVPPFLGEGHTALSWWIDGEESPEEKKRSRCEDVCVIRSMFEFTCARMKMKCQSDCTMII